MDTTVKSQFLADCSATFGANAARIAALAPMSADEANRRPDSGGWSVAQCVEHAIVGIELYLPAMKAALQRGLDRDARGKSELGRGTFLGRMLLGVLDPGRRRFKKLRAPAVFRPSESEIDWPALLERARMAHDELEAIAAAADGLDLNRLRLPSPVSRLVRVSLAQALHLHAIHVARHLDQAARVVAS